VTLDPHVAQFLLNLKLANAPMCATPEAFRASSRTFFDSVRPTELPAVETVVDVEVPTDDGVRIPARYYRPSDPAETVILYIHGGGWTVGNIETHDEIARALARDSRCRVVSLGYRLAPENPFPRPLLDCLSAWEWLLNAPAPPLGRIRLVALAGDSAGGNLCAALSLILRETGRPGPLAQLLIYPSLDLTLATSAGSLERFARGYQLTAEEIRLLVSYYTPNEADRHDRLASPIRARSHAGLPATMIATAGHDPICDDGDTYAGLLVEAGASVLHLRFGALIHGFLDFAPIVPAAMEARIQAFRLFGALVRDREVVA
jgi:acetyl esterase